MTFSIEYYYDEKQKVHWYHCDTKENYNYYKFCKWLCSMRLHYTYAEQSHQRFVFLNEKDRQDMHFLFGSDIKDKKNLPFYKNNFIDHTIEEEK